MCCLLPYRMCGLLLHMAGEPVQPDSPLAMQNQADDIAWWANYHIAMGVSRIYVHDNNSTRPLSTELDDLIADGFVQ